MRGLSERVRLDFGNGKLETSGGLGCRQRKGRRWRITVFFPKRGGENGKREKRESRKVKSFPE